MKCSRKEYTIHTTINGLYNRRGESVKSSFGIETINLVDTEGNPFEANYIKIREVSAIAGPGPVASYTGFEGGRDDSKKGSGHGHQYGFGPLGGFGDGGANGEIEGWYAIVFSSLASVPAGLDESLIWGELFGDLSGTCAEVSLANDPMKIELPISLSVSSFELAHAMRYGGQGNNFQQGFGFSITYGNTNFSNTARINQRPGGN